MAGTGRRRTISMPPYKTSTPDEPPEQRALFPGDWPLPKYRKKRTETKAERKERELARRRKPLPGQRGLFDVQEEEIDKLCSSMPPDFNWSGKQNFVWRALRFSGIKSI